jgi:hypothetical protein
MLKVLEIMREFGSGWVFLTYLLVIPAVAVYKRYLAPKRTIDERFKSDIVTWLVYTSFDKRYSGRLESVLYEDISTLAEHTYEMSPLLKNLRTKSI